VEAQSENVQIVLRGYEALNRGDIDAAAAHMAAEFEFTLPPMLPDYDTESRGPEEFKRTWLGWRDQFEDFRLEVEEAFDAGNGRVLVMAATRGVGKGSRAEVRSPSFAQIWTLEDGVVVSMLSLPNRATALGELGLGPKVDWE
jgi:ketosteroid isomerase-like protein